MRKRNLSLGRSFYAPKTYVWKKKYDNNHFGAVIYFYVYLGIIRTTGDSKYNLWLRINKIRLYM